MVNPIAGMGGRVGLKGTDGDALEEAIARGAEPVSPRRAVEFLRRLRSLGLEPSVEVVTCPGLMGEYETASAGFSAEVLPMEVKAKTTAEDTKAAVRLMVELAVDLLVFVGGDGTARDILDAMRKMDSIPVLGVPSGVKMYSGVFAASPSDAADIVDAVIKRQADMMDFEVMDIDEDAFRRDRLSIRLYGFLRGPFVPMRLVGSKQATPETLEESENQLAIARFVVEEMDPEGVYVLGPGTTVKKVADLLGVDKTVLGVDLYRGGSVLKDVDERTILREIKGVKKVWIVVSPIGRQGMLFGRGNQQISPNVIKAVGKERIIVLATKGKIQNIEGGVLRVDTGDPDVDEMLRGYLKVITDYREWRMIQVQ
ncbi:MAG: ATP-NAD kinase [Candidatus Bathyarchaeota archaeon B26-2]|nr:MAG: ATP-NAD kinase [Candidatus Bathyarchaeota archaeon B26-2]